MATTTPAAAPAAERTWCQTLTCGFCGGNDAAPAANASATSTTTTPAAPVDNSWISQDTIDTAKYCFSLAFVNAAMNFRNDKLTNSNIVMKAVAYIVTEVAMIFGLALSIVEGVVREALAFIITLFVSCGVLSNDTGSFYGKFENGGRLALLAGLRSFHGIFQNLNPKQNMNFADAAVVNFHPVLDSIFNLDEAVADMRHEIYEISNAAAEAANAASSSSATTSTAADEEDDSTSSSSSSSTRTTSASSTTSEPAPARSGLRGLFTRNNTASAQTSSSSSSSSSSSARTAALSPSRGPVPTDVPPAAVDASKKKNKKAAKPATAVVSDE